LFVIIKSQKKLNEAPLSISKKVEEMINSIHQNMLRGVYICLSDCYKWLLVLVNIRFGKSKLRLELHLRDINLKHWLESNIFSPVWWLLLISFITLWVIWWKFVNKTKLLEIVTYGLLVSFLSTILNLFGTEFVLWGYPNNLVPVAPLLFEVDLGFLPVIYMLIYQYFPDWIKFTIVISITAVIIAFMGEPLAIRLYIYEMNNWKHIYSFPLYIALGLILKMDSEENH
jgi:hypothetical protein